MKGLLRVSPLSVGVAVVVAAASVAGFFFFKHGDNQQEQVLLEADAGQAALYLTSVFGGELAGPLDSLATAVTLSGGSTAAFQARAQPLAKIGLDAVMARREAGGYVVIAATGTTYSVGQTLDAATTVTLAKAGSTDVAGPVEYDGKQSVSYFAVGPPLAPPGTAIFLEISLNPFVASSVTAAKPFALLKVALYGSPTATMSHLLVSTAPRSQLPLPSGSVTKIAEVAGSKWALVATPRSSLTGSFATNAPYIILVLGLFLALMVGVALETVERRRRYADAVVAERTADLERTVNDLRDAQDALVRGERLTALGEMASVVGHELRNPLAAVINALYLLRRYLGEPADASLEKHLSMAERETAKAATLAEDLTAFVRPREPSKEEVDVATLVDEVVQAAPPPREVSLDVAVEPMRVMADRNQLAEVLTNLLTNAYQAMDGPGTVRIAARNGSGVAELSIEDSGPGIDAAAAAKVFEPFFTTKHDGTGLGLAIVQRLVEAHGGTVGFHDGARTSGARVVVRIPVHEAEAAR